ncbi:MAG: Tn3 family transposase [Verrucomicrobia bacterium]|nr:Tn3 family transposase [Verrucomicrobiota bacterium]
MAGSLKLGWVTASLFIAKLQSFRRQNALTRALQEYGRLNKTIFILRYLLDESFQWSIGAQINKPRGLARATWIPLCGKREQDSAPLSQGPSMPMLSFPSNGCGARANPPRRMVRSGNCIRRT